MHSFQAASVIGLHLGQPAEPIALEIGRWLLTAAGVLFLAYVLVLAVLVGISGIKHAETHTGHSSRD
jgi:hypothetical protein